MNNKYVSFWCGTSFDSFRNYWPCHSRTELKNSLWCWFEMRISFNLIMLITLNWENWTHFKKWSQWHHHNVQEVHTQFKKLVKFQLRFGLLFLWNGFMVIFNFFNVFEWVGARMQSNVTFFFLIVLIFGVWYLALSFYFYCFLNIVFDTSSCLLFIITVDIVLNDHHKV